MQGHRLTTIVALVAVVLTPACAPPPAGAGDRAALAPTVGLLVESEPPGLRLGVGAAVAPVALRTRMAPGARLALVAPRVRRQDGRLLGFVRWSDGGDAAHVLVIPPVDAHVVAFYRRIASPRATVPRDGPGSGPAPRTDVAWAGPLTVAGWLTRPA